MSRRCSTESVRRSRAREKAFERCATITVWSSLATLLIDLGLLKESELEDRKALARACEALLRNAENDRQKWIGDRSIGDRARVG
jgi:hypothetical protein